MHIIDHTYPLVEDDKQNCCASIDVYFCAEGLIVMVGEILHGCVCIEKSNVNMFARKGDNIVISISRSEEQLASYITKGSKVSLIATEAQYTVNKSQMLDNPAKFAGRIKNTANAKNVIRFQWIKDPEVWDCFHKTFLLV
jgi:hypothetical protein